MKDNIFENIINAIPTHNQDTDYVKDGIRYCGNCGEPRQKLVNIFGSDRPMPVACKCIIEMMRKDQEERAEQEFQAYLRSKGGGLSATAYKDYRFDKDDGCSPKAMDIAKRYVERFPEMKGTNTGLIFGGSVGTGKTFIAGCIANALLAKRIPVLMTSFPQVINNLSTIKEKNEYIDNIVSFDLLILDDLGVERSSDYGLEQLFNVVDARYKAKLPLIVTTNPSMKELRDNQSLALKRIYDRILEMCAIPVLVEGNGRRGGVAKDKAIEAKKILGL